MSILSLASIGYDDAERHRGMVSPQTVATTIHAVHDTGAVYGDNDFNTGFFAPLHDECGVCRGCSFKNDLYDNALNVGNRHMLISIELSWIFNRARDACSGGAFTRG